jgi:small subunit ribosomal protein S8
MHSDPIADMLTRIRNGGKARLAHVDIPMAKIKVEIAKILQVEGLISSHEVVTEGKFPMLRVHLKYRGNKKHAISHIQRVSKPGLRVYKEAEGVLPVRSGLGLLIVSTSQGIVTDRDARRRGIGGEVLCEVW